MRHGEPISGVVAIALCAMVACSRQPSGSASAKITAATNAAVEAQLNAAKELGIPVEKTLPKSGIVLRLIPAGTFAMGSTRSERDAVIDSVPEGVRVELRKLLDRETQHKVTLSTPFYIGKYEVTQGQWKKVMGKNPSCFTNAGDTAPVEMVSWSDCTRFMEKLAVLERMPKGSFRLPTESEWEYACRAGSKTAFCYGDDLDSSMANFNGNYPYGRGQKGEYRQKTVSVGHFEPNGWGLYDMHGNVWEWCADWYGEYREEAGDPRGPATGSGRVTRGASWNIFAAYCRSANRYYREPGLAFSHGGFRLVMPAGK